MTELLHWLLPTIVGLAGVWVGARLAAPMPKPLYYPPMPTTPPTFTALDEPAWLAEVEQPRA